MNEPAKQEKARVFIASSSEALELAQAIQTNLSDVAYVSLWDEVIEYTSNILMSLISASKEYDLR